MKRALFLALLLSFQTPVFAEYLELSDGRVCKDCKVEISKGFVISIKDQSGDEWINPEMPLKVFLIKHHILWPITSAFTTPAGAPAEKEPEKPVYQQTPKEPTFAKKFLYGLGDAAQSYSTLQRQTPPKNWNCNSYGTMTNCHGY